MAFNQRLESDTPTGSLGRHPLLGAIVWLFGGGESEASPPPPRGPSEGDGGGADAARAKAGGVAGSAGLTERGSLSPSSSTESTSSKHDSAAGPSLRRNNRLSDSGRRMSWSDESGQDLVQVFDLNKSASQLRGSGSSSSLEGRPVKSAMKRSGSTLGSSGRLSSSGLGPPPSSSDDGGAPLDPLGNPFLSALDRSAPGQSSHIGLSSMSPGTAYESTDVVGSLPGPKLDPYSPAHQYFNRQQTVNQAGKKSPKDGQVSPQWGWYISTTPPTAPHGMFEKVEVGRKEGKKSGLAMALGGPGE